MGLFLNSLLEVFDGSFPYRAVQAERLSLNQLHYDKAASIRLTYFVDSNDVRVIES